MTRPVYSTLFVAESVPAGTPMTGLLPPAGFIAVVRDISAWTAPSNIGAECQIYVTPPNSIFFDANNLAAGDSLVHWEGRVVIPQGKQLNVYCISYAWDVTISGYLLSLP